MSICLEPTGSGACIKITFKNRLFQAVGSKQFNYKRTKNKSK